MEVVFAIISIVAAVLQIILFFKLWGMTNDVRKLKDAVIGNFRRQTRHIKKRWKHLPLNIWEYP